MEHLLHLQHLAAMRARIIEVAQAKAQRIIHTPPLPPASGGGYFDPSGQLTRSQVGEIWLLSGGPSWAETQAENVAYCESGWNTHAYNPSGASGLWQILGQVVSGYIFDARVNGLNAVSKFKASGDTWSQWVCQP